MPPNRRRRRPPAVRLDDGAVDLDGRRVPYRLRRSKRRRKTIEFTIHDGQLQIAAPWHVADRDVADLLRRRQRWILDRIDQPPPPKLADQLRQDGRLPLFGQDLHVAIDPELDCPAKLLDDRLILREPDPDAVRALFSEFARDRIDSLIQHWAPIAKVRPRQIHIRNQKRRWGSAAQDGVLRFNWRLAFAPPDIVEYVVVHELCHLRRLDHSPQFWRIVESVLPDAQERRRRLRQIEDRLHW